MAALQIQAEHASSLIDQDDMIMQCIEKYVIKQVCGWVCGSERVSG